MTRWKHTATLTCPYRPVRVHPDNQRVTESARFLKIADVTRMQQIEDAIGEDDRLAGVAQRPGKSSGVFTGERPAYVRRCQDSSPAGRDSLIPSENCHEWRGR